MFEIIMTPVAILVYLVVLIISCALAHHYGKREGRLLEMAKDYSRKFDVPIDRAMWIIKNSQPIKS